MTKLQKIGLWVGGALFLIPEILWSTALKMAYGFIMPTVNGSYQIIRKNFLDDTSVENLWSNVLLIQFLGTLIFTIALFTIRNSFKNKYLFWFIFILSCVITITMFGVHGISTIEITF